MSKKKVVVVIKSNPFGWKTFEALRQAVGMAMDHDVTVVFLKDGVYTLTDWRPQLIGVPLSDKSIEALSMLGGKIYAEKESISERGLIKSIKYKEVQQKSKDEICNLIKEAEVVITW
ncbi:MAG: DsrE family protein [Hydrogenothermaceae bacterium]|nr:DsrE family protein [Hydrogenothermaceae bacterium]